MSIFISDTDRPKLNIQSPSQNTPTPPLPPRPPPYLNTPFLLNFAYIISRDYIFWAISIGQLCIKGFKYRDSNVLTQLRFSLQKV